MRCPICQKSLYQKLSFATLFRIQKYHITCEKLLLEDVKESIIPIQDNTITFRYLLDNKNSTYHQENILFLTFYKLLASVHNYQEWSVIFWYENDAFYLLDSNTKYLLLNMGKKPLLFLSLYAENIS